MSKQGGLGDALYWGGYDLTGDINVYNTTAPMTPLDVTGIGSSNHERIGGLRDGSIDCTSFFNPASSQAHSVFKTLPRTDVITTICRGTILGSAAVSQISKQLNYDPTRDNAGNFTFKIEADANGYGQDWGVLLTAGKRTDTTATAGSVVDLGQAAAYGFQAYLQVFAFTGTDVTIKVQNSTTSGGSYTDITSGAFTQVTSTTPQAQRIAVGGTAAVDRYVKVTTVTTGGFTSVTFAVVFTQNPVVTVF
jgi:hypothetical protein